MNFGSLFAGIGGIDLGFERAGMACKWQVENDPYCIKILEKHWPHVKRYGDIKRLKGGELEKVDVIAGGFPCQPVSTAGQRKGEKDERWLWHEFRRIIRALRPEYIVVENVPGLLNMGLNIVLGDLVSCGYDCEWESIPAIAFGAPHQRYRVFIVAHSYGRRFKGTAISIRSRRQDEAQVIPHRNGEVKPPHKQGFKGYERTFGGREKSRVFNHELLKEKTTWPIEPAVCRVVNGVPNRVDRIKALGNAVVPQVAEYVANCILRHKLG